ncbi:DUF6542 domain-containing protein [Amycolatopsis sp. WQ 127309]|uniref:DUF6542 domain-containing protein n=1 Tax=Amycolatopsis sp. WQ 127309 TaxID=2932773 RepID=UPI001FF39DDD|nr:DUF6542 domain-containing protein [Amycolatopsis sp. WQ 127309]UOZ07687.1 hypothetical protein MUY22_05185 [Amycolatopsis sp. WQ 127309]
MTAIRDRQSDPDADDVPVPWDERPVVGSRRGLPWWAAVLVGLGLAVVGALVGKPSQGSIPAIFTVCYVLGAVIAVGAVRRRGIFGPMVMPPLVLAVTVPSVILLTSGSQGDDMLSKALNIGTPLINAFPMMAITTGVTLLIGFVRIFREKDPDAPVKAKGGKADRRRADEDDEKPAARAAATSAGGRPRPPGSSRTGQTPVPQGARRGREGEPPRRPRPPAEGERRTPRAAGAPAERDPGTRGTRKPPPANRRPRPEEADPRRREPRGDAPRRRPRPPAEDGRDTPPPRRPSAGGRGAPPRRNRPWDEEER